MGNRTNRLIVVLETDMRDEDLDAVTDAIRMLRGVLVVDAIEQDPGEAFVAKMRAQQEVRERILQLLKELR